MLQRLLHILTFFLLSFLSLPLFAQVSGAVTAKNIMVKHNRISKAKLSAQITLDGNYQTGNTEKANVSTTVFVSAVDSAKEFAVNGRFMYGENNKKINQREYVAGLQYDYHPYSVVTPFVRFEFYQNPFRQIKGRYSGLAGAKYRFWVKPQMLDYSISAAFLYDFDHFVHDANLPDKERYRISIRPKFKQYMTERVYLITEVFYKPNLAHFCDYIVCGNININFRFLKQGLLRISYEYQFENRPPTHKVKKTDALLLAGLGITL